MKCATSFHGIPLQFFSNEPMILIGTNNWKLVVPRRLREGKWNDPIASKCILGWGLEGSTSSKTAFSMHHCQCNWDEIEKIIVWYNEVTQAIRTFVMRFMTFSLCSRQERGGIQAAKPACIRSYYQGTLRRRLHR